MAPRNNTKNKNTNQKNPKSSKPRIVKSNPKSPNDIKIEVPVKKSLGRSRRVTTKKQELSDKQKVILADEVVNYQLNKKSRILNFNKEIPTVEVVNDERKTEHVVSTFLQERKGRVGQVIENVKKKATKKITLDNNVVAKKPLTRKRSADSTQKTEKSQKAQKPIVKPKRTRVTRNSVKVQQKEIIEGKANVKEEFKNKDAKSESPMINLQTNGTRSPVLNCAGHIDSRKTSSTSNSCMSWTKDLSSSSRTSLPATSNDFVRIDKKLPILKLTSMNSTRTNETAEPVIKDEDNSSVDSHCSGCTNSNLSTSSLSTLPNNKTPSHQSDTLKDELSKAFDKLTTKLKYFDVEIMRWIGYGKESTDVGFKGFQDIIIKTLKEECEVITHCRNLKTILSDDSELKSGKDPDGVTVETHSDKLVVIPRNVAEYGSKGKNSLIDQVVHNTISDTVCNDNNSKLTESYDDDDALSIYAESLTGIESEKITNSITTPLKNFKHVEYIPEPIKKIEIIPNKYSYCPTKINENNKLIVKKSICEKQNADSTSLFKDNYFGRATEGDVNSISSECTQNEINDVPTKIALIPEAAINKEPILVNDTRNRQGQGSGVLKDICNFNLFNRCKNAYCRYLHIVPDVLEVKTKLQGLNDDEFISEYKAIRKLYAVSRKYGLCFVEECCNRDMLKLSLDMVTHFFTTAIIKTKEDSVIIREILECVLMKLNNVDLNVCEESLMKSVTPTMLLCDIFMQTIAETQNFSRFKIVFLNLTHFIVSRDGIFNLFVAEHILERVCILPPEKPLARALLDIMKHTDTAIFKNSMLSKFENMLLTLDKNMQSDFLTVKMKAIGCLLATPSLSSASSHYSNSIESTIPVNIIPNIGDKAYISPDTTDANDSKNKFLGTATITRTVNFSKPQFNKVVKINAPYVNKDKWQKANNFKSWTQKPMNNFPRPLLNLPVTKPVLEPNNRKYYVSYRPTVTRYQSRPQRDLF